jgi:hypothetical protein
MLLNDKRRPPFRVAEGKHQERAYDFRLFHVALTSFRAIHFEKQVVLLNALIYEMSNPNLRTFEIEMWRHRVASS